MKKRMPATQSFLTLCISLFTLTLFSCSPNEENNTARDLQLYQSKAFDRSKDLNSKTQCFTFEEIDSLGSLVFSKFASSDDIPDGIKSEVPFEHARIFIDYYRSSEPESAKKLNSVWINKEVIDYIAKNATSLDGLRIYMAKYKESVGRIGTAGQDERVDKLCMLIAPTYPQKSSTISKDGAYFNYSELCPPYKCDY